jgi:hypothetical protein
MNRSFLPRSGLLVVLVSALFLVGCVDQGAEEEGDFSDNQPAAGVPGGCCSMDSDTVSQNVPAAQDTGTKEQKPQQADNAKPEQAGKQVQIGKNVVLEILPDDTRRVLVYGYVCMREGQLEQLMCRKLTKEHEAILAADCDARIIHAALVAAKAVPGSPVKFAPQFVPASGTTIKVNLQYKDKNGKTITEPAQKWIRHFETKKELKYDWVFAGSRFSKNFDPNLPDRYEANEGDVICVSNFETAMLDLPVQSSRDTASLVWQANTERIPPENTPVTIILEPVLKMEKK